jgi:hypothetical protein
MRLSGAADVDDTGPLKFVGEDIHDQLEDIVVEGAERAVNEHPRRILQQDAGDREAELLVLTQFSLPTVSRIEQRRETFETQPVERTCESALGEALGLQWIGKDFA